MTTCIETYTGKLFNYANPQPDQVDVRDIARALSLTVRFGGHVSRFYSVAEHALRVSELVEDISDPELAYAALHHDSHEAYIGDLPSPLKRMVGAQYERLGLTVDRVIGDALGIRVRLFDHPFIKEADAQALRMEAGRLKHSFGVGPHWGQLEPLDGFVSYLAPTAAETRFIQRHRRLRLELGL